MALRKVKSLLECRARITVVSPELCRRLKLLHKKELFVYKKYKYQKKFLKNNFLVIAATNDERVNKKVAADAMAMNLLVNVVDSPQECNFYVPAMMRKNEMLLTISTQGAFPGMSRKIKEECAPVFHKYAKFFKRLTRLRKEIYGGDETSASKRILMKNLIRSDVLEMIGNKTILDVNDLKEYLKKI